jgi:type IV secretory pathway VirJ component
MKRLSLGIAVINFFLWTAATFAAALGKEQTMAFGPFGKVSVYGAENRNPQDVVIFLSGDGGWKQGVISMARQLVDENAIVIGVDVVHYQKAVAQLKASCTYAAADFENLSKYVQRKLKLPRYRPPLLVGYSSGATLVYALLAQAPAHTFRGGLSLGFCNDLLMTKPLCTRNELSWKMGSKKNLYLFDATENLENPWIALNGEDDKVCPGPATRKFVAATKTGVLDLLPRVGHGFSVERNWVPQFIAHYKKMAPPVPEPRDAQLQDLPLIEEVPSPGKSSFFVILLTGDGGWAGIDRDLALELSDEGVPVIGWNSLEYLWDPKSPDQGSKDLKRVIDHYTQRLGIPKVRLVGYSLGADILPFMVNRLPPEVLARVEKLVLLGPSLSTTFEFHVSDWLGSSSSDDEKPTTPEVQKIKKTPIICIYGEEEEESLCREKSLNLKRSVPMKGGHHFGGDYAALVPWIIDSSGL